MNTDLGVDKFVPVVLGELSMSSRYLTDPREVIVSLLKHSRKRLTADEITDAVEDFCEKNDLVFMLAAYETLEECLADLVQGNHISLRNYTYFVTGKNDGFDPVMLRHFDQIRNVQTRS